MNNHHHLHYDPSVCVHDDCVHNDDDDDTKNVGGHCETNVDLQLYDSNGMNSIDDGDYDVGGNCYGGCGCGDDDYYSAYEYNFH